jgi:catechol 2,3-dioxygenase-like lactoylglutathione lyase family enzyme
MTAHGPGHPPLLGLRHVALVVADLAAAERFWVDVVGYQVEWRPDADNVYLRGGHDNLALHHGPARRPADGSGQLDHIGLAVAQPGDVDAWAAHLRAHGVTLKTEPRTHRDGSRSLYFHGPEEILIQIIHHAPMVS